jgi:hypothetical protein
MFIQSADSRRSARKLAVTAACEKQQAEEIREAERARQEAIADAELEYKVCMSGVVPSRQHGHLYEGAKTILCFI